MEQVVELFALACSKPGDYGRPISHWTARELAEEMVKQGIVEYLLSTSRRTTVRRSDLIKHARESLLVDIPKRDEKSEAKVQNISNLYLSAMELNVVGERTVYVDAECLRGRRLTYLNLPAVC